MGDILDAIDELRLERDYVNRELSQLEAVYSRAQRMPVGSAVSIHQSRRTGHIIAWTHEPYGMVATVQFCERDAREEIHIDHLCPAAKCDTAGCQLGRFIRPTPPPQSTKEPR